MAWIITGAVEAVEEKTESFDVIEKATGKVTGINRITSRRKIKITDYEKRSYQPLFNPSNWTSDADVGGWFTGPRCIEHAFKFKPITKMLLETKRVEGFSSWVIIGNKYEDVPGESDPAQPPPL